VYVLRLTGAVLAAAFLWPGAAAAQVVEYYHLDALGSVRAVTNQAGQVVERHDFLPYGEECTTAPCSGALPGTNTFKFTGKERDTESGLDYFRARYYAAPRARFTSVDPVFTLPENRIDPQRWNRYAYGRNNPLKYVDPSGRILELTGEDRVRDFKVIQQVAGRGAGHIKATERGGRTFVEFTYARAEGPLLSSLASIIASEKTVEFQFTTERHIKVKGWFGLTGTFDIGRKGGAATVGQAESVTGNTQVFIHINSVHYMNRLADSLLGGPAGVAGLTYTNATIAAHELGHAEADAIHGVPTTVWPSDAWALIVENEYRDQRGLKHRTKH
jgi:RHS repeat-associated protein